MSFLQPLDAGELDRILANISTLVAIESPTHDAEGVNRVLDEVIQQFKHTGATIDRLKTEPGFGDIVRVRSAPQSSKPGILVLSHVDTVHPVGALAGPLPLRREGDKVYGPGIYDMKAGFAIAIAAFRQIVTAGVEPHLPITFLFTPDEEIGSPVSRRLIEAEAVRNKYALVTEPARDGGKIVTARKGVARFKITAKGVPAHAGTAHHKGHSAIRAMAQIITEIEGFTDYGRGITASVGLINGGSGVNVIPEHCTIEADLRVFDMDSANEMVARFHALRSSDPAVELTVEGDLNRPPFTRDAGIDGLFDKAAAVARAIGFELQSCPMTGGGSDGNFTASLGIATLDGLGVDGDGAHTNHEHILASSIGERTCLMRGLMETLD